MITVTTEQGPAGGKKKTTSITEMRAKDAVDLLEMDLMLNRTPLGRRRTHILIEEYDRKFTMCTHTHFTGPQKEMKRLMAVIRGNRAVRSA